MKKNGGLFVSIQRTGKSRGGSDLETAVDSWRFANVSCTVNWSIVTLFYKAFIYPSIHDLYI